MSQPAETPAPRRGPRAGFTLLEVLIAFAIAALTIAVLLQGTVGALRAAGTAREYQNALVRARSRLAAVEAGGLAEGVRDGEDGGGFAWRTDIRALGQTRDVRAAAAAQGPLPTRPALYAVSVVVRWGAGPRERSVRLDSELLGLVATAPSHP